MPVFTTHRKKKLTFGVKDDPTPHSMPSQMPAPQKAGNISTPRVLEQTGYRKDILRDASRKALMPGKRISKTGNVYWETRKNRSDAFKSSL